MVNAIILLVVAYMCIGVGFVLYHEKLMIDAMNDSFGRDHPHYKLFFPICMLIAALLWPVLIVGEMLDNLKKRLRKRKES